MSNHIRRAYIQATMPENAGREFSLTIHTVGGGILSGVRAEPYFRPYDPIRRVKGIDLLICRDSDGDEHVFNDYSIVCVTIVWVR